jgi:hypothetical protein
MTILRTSSTLTTSTAPTERTGSTGPTGPTVLTGPTQPTERTVPPLLQTLRDLATDPGLRDLIQPDAVERRWVEVPIGPDLQAWVISWPGGTSTGWHDHGAVAAGAFVTLTGRLTEYTWHSGPYARTLGPGQDRSFPAGHIHDVRNPARTPALSLHVYAPRLTTMSRYRLEDGRLRLTSVEAEGGTW